MAAKQASYGVGVDELKRKLKLEPKGAYLFFGEEEYLKKFYLQKLRDLVEDNGFRQLNHTRFDFANKTVADLEEEASQLPMMSSLRLVEVWGMQPLKLSEKEQKKLLELLEHLSEDSILVIYCLESELTVEKSTATKAFPRRLAELVTAVNFVHLGEHALLGWIDKVLAATNLRSTEQAARLLVQLCGGDMLKIRGELHKLEAYLKSGGRSEVTREDVKRLVHGDSDAQLFQLTDAIFARNAAQSAELFEGLKAQRVEPVVIAGWIAKAVGCAALSVAGVDAKVAWDGAQMAEWQLRSYRDKTRAYDRSYFSRALELCLDCDRKLKSQGQDGYVPVENLVFTLIQLGVEKSSFYK